MTMQFTQRDSSLSRSHAADRRMCRRLVAATLPAFLVAAAIRRILPAGWTKAAPGRRQSLWAEARASAYATIPFMFMG